MALRCRCLFHEIASVRKALFLWSPEAPGGFKQRPPISIAPSSPLLPLHEEVEALLFLSEGKPYLLEVCPCSSKAFLFISPIEKHLLLFVISYILHVILIRVLLGEIILSQ